MCFCRDGGKYSPLERNLEWFRKWASFVGRKKKVLPGGGLDLCLCAWECEMSSTSDAFFLSLFIPQTKIVSTFFFRSSVCTHENNIFNDFQMKPLSKLICTGSSIDFLVQMHPKVERFLLFLMGFSCRYSLDTGASVIPCQK